MDDNSVSKWSNVVIKDNKNSIRNTIFINLSTSNTQTNKPVDESKPVWTYIHPTTRAQLGLDDSQTNYTPTNNETASNAITNFITDKVQKAVQLTPLDFVPLAS